MQLLSLAFTLALALPASPRERIQVAWSCDLDGSVGHLEAEYDTVALGEAEVSPAREDINDFIASGTGKVFFSGRLTLTDRSYVFSGEDHLAEFTNTSTLERFLVHLRREGDILRLSEDRGDGADKVYYCQLVN
jgi:hypothetical protein